MGFMVGETVHYGREVKHFVEGNERDVKGRKKLIVDHTSYWCVPATVIAARPDGKFLVEAQFDNLRDGKERERIVCEAGVGPGLIHAMHDCTDPQAHLPGEPATATATATE